MQEIMRSLWSPYGRHSHFCKFRLEDGHKCSNSSSSLFLITYIPMTLWKTLPFMWIPAGMGGKCANSSCTYGRHWHLCEFRLENGKNYWIPAGPYGRQLSSLQIQLENEKNAWIPDGLYERHMLSFKSRWKMGKMLDFHLDLLKRFNSSW